MRYPTHNQQNNGYDGKQYAQTNKYDKYDI